VDKHIFPAAVRSDETVPLFGVEPFHCAGLLDRWPVRCHRLGTRPLCPHWSGGTAIDAHHLGDMRPFVSWADAHFEGFAQLHGIDSALSEDTPVEEGIAGFIGEFDEAKAFLGTEPFDDTADRWTGGCLKSSLAEPGTSAESTGLWVVGIVVEVTTSRTKILLSHFSFLGVETDQPD